MAGEISTKDWDEFIDVVTQAIVGHQEVSFIETVAMALKDGVYDEYKVQIFLNDDEDSSKFPFHLFELIFLSLFLS